MVLKLSLFPLLWGKKNSLYLQFHTFWSLINIKPGLLSIVLWSFGAEKLWMPLRTVRLRAGTNQIVFLLLHLATQTRRNTIKWGKHLTLDQFDSLWIKGSVVSGVWFHIKYDWMDRGKLCWMVIIAFSSSLQLRRLPKDCSGCVPFQINTHWTNGDCWRVQISVQTDKSQLWTQQQFRP